MKPALASAIGILAILSAGCQPEPVDIKYQCALLQKDHMSLARKWSAYPPPDGLSITEQLFWPYRYRSEHPNYEIAKNQLIEKYRSRLRVEDPFTLCESHIPDFGSLNKRIP